MPPDSESRFWDCRSGIKESTVKDILETLTGEGSFNTLLAALKTTELTDRLKGEGPFTLFAPNDQAFQRVNVDEIAKDQSGFVTTLNYHLLAGRVTSPDIGRRESLLTRAGKSLTVHLHEGHVVVDNANLVRADIECSNGVIHVIDNVFLPQFSGWYCGSCC